MGTDPIFLRAAPSYGKWGLSPFFLLAAWVFPGLLGHDPWKPDEAYTFGLVYHILQTGDWVVPTLGGEPFVEKPPVFFWTAALFAWISSPVLALHDGARLASAFYVGVTLWFTYLLAGRRLAAPLLLAACLGYLQHAHQLITDNALMAGFAMGLYGIAASRPLLLGTGAGLAFLSKGLLGPGLLGLIALLFTHWRTWPLALAAFVPWALIWPALLYRASPALFHEWFVVNNFGRFTGSAGLGGVLDHLHYAKALPWFALPAWPLAAWALWQRPRAPELRLPLAAFAIVFLVLSAASSARTLYGLPLLVPLAVLAAHGLDSAPRWLTRTLVAIAAAGLLAGLVLWGAWLAFLAGWRHAFFEAQAPGFTPGFGYLAFAAAAAVTLICAAGWRRGELSMRLLAGAALPWGLAMTLWLPWLDHGKSYRGVIAEMQSARAAVPGCVQTQGLTEPQRALFHYFAEIKTDAVRADCPLLLVHTASATPPGGGNLLWSGRRPGDDKEFFWLYRRSQEGKAKEERGQDPFSEDRAERGS